MKTTPESPDLLTLFLPCLFFFFRIFLARRMTSLGHLFLSHWITHLAFWLLFSPTFFPPRRGPDSGCGFSPYLLRTLPHLSRFSVFSDNPPTFFMKDIDHSSFPRTQALPVEKTLRLVSLDCLYPFFLPFLGSHYTGSFASPGGQILVSVESSLLFWSKPDPDAYLYTWWFEMFPSN